MRSLLVLVAALAATTAELDTKAGRTRIDRIYRLFSSEAGAGPVNMVTRGRRAIWPFSSNPNEYSCQIAPYVSFYPADNSEPMPAYLCWKDHIEVLIATRSFHLGHSRYEYATYANVQIDPNILHIEYPGAFMETPASFVYKHSNGIPQSPTVEITGLLFLTEGGVQRRRPIFNFLSPSMYSCNFMPGATFHNAEINSVPVYRCVRGVTEIVIATDSFVNPYNSYEVSLNIELEIGDDVLNVYYPGSFHQVSSNAFRGNPQLTHKGGRFLVRGLLRLADF